MVSEIEYDEWVEELEAEVARLREALRLIYIRADVQADEPIYELAEAALSTPADDWLERHDAEVRERCAGIADHLGQHHHFNDSAYDVAKKIATAICEAETMRIAATVKEGNDGV